MYDHNRATVLAQSIILVFISFFFFHFGVYYVVTDRLNNNISLVYCRNIFIESQDKMRSSHDSHNYSSTSSTSRYRSPSTYLDLAPTNGASDRAEFRDRYQNRVTKKSFFFI